MPDWLATQFGTVSPGEVLLRLTVAAVLGGLVGLEREVQDKPAGLKTFALVSLGAAAFVLTAIQADITLADPDWEVRFDPTRLVTSVATGIGFLGAGAIFTAGRKVHGLTTGAGIWAAGAVGVAAGIGQVALAFIVTVLALAVLVVLRAIERWIP